jgi:hypothetical protein
MKNEETHRSERREKVRDYGFIGAVLIVVLSAVIELSVNFGTLRNERRPPPPLFTKEMASDMAAAIVKIDRMYDWHAEVDENGVPMWYDRTSATEARWYEEIRRRTNAVHDVLQDINEDTRAIRNNSEAPNRLRGPRVEARSEVVKEAVASAPGRPCRTTALRGRGARHGMTCHLGRRS